MRAAELIATKYRYDLMAATMVGQVRCVDMMPSGVSDAAIAIYLCTLFCS